MYTRHKGSGRKNKGFRCGDRKGEEKIERVITKEEI
jgi:hypothetical protein